MIFYLRQYLWFFFSFQVAFGVGLGIFNGFTTVIESFVRPCGYTSDDAGLFGALIIGGGFLGAALFGWLMDYTHQYKLLCKIAAGLAIVATVLFSSFFNCFLNLLICIIIFLNSLSHLLFLCPDISDCSGPLPAARTRYLTHSLIWCHGFCHDAYSAPDLWDGGRIYISCGWRGYVAFGLGGLHGLSFLDGCHVLNGSFHFLMEAVSAGLLMFGGSTVGVGMVYALAALIDLRASYTDVYTPASIFIVATMIVCVACYFSLNGTQVIC